MECDEHICVRDMYSCGDGQCISWITRMAFQRLLPAQDDCFNKRNLNYMCEVSPHKRAWTLENGLCWPDERYNDTRYHPWNMINSSKLTNDEKCQYLFRCILSNNFEHDCPCNHHNCREIMMSVCPLDNHLVLYPPQGLINPNFLYYYNYSQSMKNPNVDVVILHGNIKCRGYYFMSNETFNLPMESSIIIRPRINYILCGFGDRNGVYRDFLSPFQYDKFCWNESLTFNGRPYAVIPDICAAEVECISQYRIHDGFADCLDWQDEETIFDKNYCTGSAGRHRFQCFNDEHRCLPLLSLNTDISLCSNDYDERYYGVGVSLTTEMKCWKGNTKGCGRLKEYIGQSSTKNSSINGSLINSQGQKPTNQIPFRSYCDSFWDLDKHIDELTSSCQYWVCHFDQYQCQTGQCIELDWVCDGEWDCADASDEEAILPSEDWSSQNRRLSNLTSRHELCRQRYSQSPFSKICNTSFEFGCYLSRVLNPLDIKLNRPCINLTQIGDGVEDCYNAYDERNTLEANPGLWSMFGFDLRCGSEVIDYLYACEQSITTNCTNLLCSYYRDDNGSCSENKDVICLEDNHCQKNARCNGNSDCFHGEDEYWCASDSDINQVYRSYKRKIKQESFPSFLVPSYPLVPILISNQQQVNESIVNPRNDQFFTMHSYQCNRGVAILEMNETRCLCSPAYYGHWCEFFSDRISIIAHVDQKTLPKTISNITLKIKTNFLFNNTIIDHHEFIVIPIIESAKNIKHKFYVLYSRSNNMLEHKRRRYFNRTDVINNHPYLVHFDTFLFEKNNSMRELGSWHYPIYFDYLPAFRLAIVLRFPSWFGNVTLDPCFQNICNENSTCMPIFNENNSYYCSCKSGYYEKDCSMYDRRCETYCSVNALCRRDNYGLHTNRSNPYCICPPNHFGPRCNLKYDSCGSSPCLNNGTCLLSYNLNGEASYLCTCLMRFYGDRCQNEKVSVRVDLNLTNMLFALATVVQLHDIDTHFHLRIQHQQVYYGLPLMIRYDHGATNAPILGLLKIYEDVTNPQYFIVYALKTLVTNITSTPVNCPHSSSLLSKGEFLEVITLIGLPGICSDINPSVPAVFQYHHVCQNDTELFCFHDENYLCICEEDHYRVDCFNYDTQLDHCDNCLSGGKCLQGNRKDPNDFLCLCPSCYQGRRCEFSMQAFGFTLDSLLIGYSKEVKIVYVTLVFILFTVSLFNNLCSFIVFKRPALRKCGVGNYLFIVTCLNQATWLCLLFKFIQITFGILNVEACKAIPYLLSVLTRSTYWLTSWVTVDRLLIILFPTSYSLRNPHLAIGISVSTLIVLFGMHVHEIIYYTIVQHLSTGSPICVTNFDTSLISTYNRISTLIHYLFPFFIQVVCTTFLIVLATRSRVKTNRQIPFGQMLKMQFQTQKELYVIPTIIILSALPQAILTFSFACTQMTDWQRHILLGSYLLSYTPQILGFILYVLPSTSYKQEFRVTSLGKTVLKPMFSKKKSTITSPKTKTATLM